MVHDAPPWHAGVVVVPDCLWKRHGGIPSYFQEQVPIGEYSVRVPSYASQATGGRYLLTLVRTSNG